RGAACLGAAQLPPRPLRPRATGGGRCEAALQRPGLQRVRGARAQGCAAADRRRRPRGRPADRLLLPGARQRPAALRDRAPRQGADRRAGQGTRLRGFAMSQESFPQTSPGARGLVYREPLIFERSVPGRMGASLPAAGVPEYDPADEIPAELLRGPIEHFPSLSENEVVRHYVRLSQTNHSIDSGFYPLGSCTMKFNPKVNEWAARLPGFANAHPYLPVEQAQGVLELMYRLQNLLSEIGGFAATSLQPAAGAHGELAGLMIIRAYHLDKEGRPRKKVLIPDSAHGTNPASAALLGYQAVELESNAQGMLEPETVAAAMDEDVAALMVTNPNTLGIFETHIREIAEIVHAKGGLV